jgi:hypothetical protein
VNSSLIEWEGLELNFSPRVIRHKDAPTYLGVNINYFDRNIRPDLPEIQFGPQMIGYDKIDLDRWLDDYKARNGWPGKGKEAKKPCRQKSKEFQVLSCVGKPGGSTRNLEAKEFAKAVKRAITTRR